MLLKVSIALQLVSLYIFIVRSANVSDKYVFRAMDMKIKSSKSFASVNPVYSTIHCVAICNQIAGCVSVSYKVGSTRCTLSREEILTNAVESSYLFYQEHFTSMAKAVYTVYQEESPLGPDQATYTDAVQICSDRNTVVATPTDLMDSRSRGYHLCACGWLSDQTNGFVLQNDSVPCALGSFQTSIIYCNSTNANVYCAL